MSLYLLNSRLPVEMRIHEFKISDAVQINLSNIRDKYDNRIREWEAYFLPRHLQLISERQKIEEEQTHTEREQLRQEQQEAHFQEQ